MALRPKSWLKQSLLPPKSWRMMDCKNLTLLREDCLETKSKSHQFVVDVGIVWTIRG